MKYPKGTFWKNLDAAKKFGDDEMVMDLFADQTTDIALAHPKALNAALEHAGVKVDTNNDDPKYLVGLVADNLQNNQKLIQNLSLMIGDINTPHKEDAAFLHTEGDAEASTDKNSTKMTGEQKAGMISGIISGVTSLAGTITGAVTGGKIEKEKNKGKMFDYLSAKENAKAAIAGQAAAAKAAIANNKTYLAVGLAVVIFGGLGFLVYLMQKKPAATGGGSGGGGGSGAQGSSAPSSSSAPMPLGM